MYAVLIANNIQQNTVRNVLMETTEPLKGHKKTLYVQARNNLLSVQLKLQFLEPT